MSAPTSAGASKPLQIHLDRATPQIPSETSPFSLHPIPFLSPSLPIKQPPTLFLFLSGVKATIGRIEVSYRSSLNQDESRKSLDQLDPKSKPTFFSPINPA